MVGSSSKRLLASLAILAASVAAELGPNSRAWAAAEPNAAASAGGLTTVDADGAFRVNGRRFFPIGLTMPPPLEGMTPWGTTAVDELVDGGVTIFRTGPHGREWSDELLASAVAWNEAAAERGVFTWVHLRELASALPGTEGEARLREVVETLKDSPGLGFWKGADEPWPRFEPADLEHAYGIVKELDPNHLFHTIFGPFSRDGTIFRQAPDPPDLRPYNAVTDTHGIDVYPIHYRFMGLRPPSLHFVGLWLAALRRATGRNAVTMTLQICFTGSKNPEGPEFVLPTRRQERYMIYDAIVNGARGLIFYGGQLARCHDERDAALGWNWTFWDSVLEDLLAEIRAGSPLHRALLRPETTVSLRTSTEKIEAISRRVSPRERWVIAAHHGKVVRKVTLRDLPRWAKSGRLHPSGKTVTAKAGKVTLYVPAWGVRVMRFTRP